MTHKEDEKMEEGFVRYYSGGLPGPAVETGVFDGIEISVGKPKPESDD